MQPLGSILFLLLFATIPVIMFGVITYRIVRWLIVRGGWKRTLEEGGWSDDVTGDEAAAAFENAGLVTGRGQLSWLASRDGAFAAYHRPRRRGRSAGTGASSKRVLAVRRPDNGPSGVIQPRVGGVLEKAALSVAAAFGGEARDIEGWEWALVMPRGGEWLDASRSASLRALLADGERLALGPRWIVLSLPEGEMPPLLGRLDALRDAFAGARVE